MTPTPHSKIKKEKRKKPNYKAIKEAVEEIKKRAKKIDHLEKNYCEALHKAKVLERKKEIRSNEFIVELENELKVGDKIKFSGTVYQVHSQHKQSLWSRIKRDLKNLLP